MDDEVGDIYFLSLKSQDSGLEKLFFLICQFQQEKLVISRSSGGWEESSHAGVANPSHFGFRSADLGVYNCSVSMLQTSNTLLKTSTSKAATVLASPCEPCLLQICKGIIPVQCV